MGTPSAGTAPSIFNKRAIIALVRLWDDAFYNMFPVQALFMLGSNNQPVLYGQNEFVVHIRKTLRKLGTEWFSGPVTGDAEALHSWTKRLFSALYLAKVYNVPPGTVSKLLGLEQLSQNEQLPPMFEAERTQHERMIAEGITDLSLFVKRQAEKLCIDTLNSDTFNLTIDGATQAWPTGMDALNAKSAAAGWDVPTTKIIEEWAKWKREFRQFAGGPPTHILVPPNFFDAMLLPNQDLREFLVRNPEMRTAQTEEMVPELRVTGTGAQVIVCEDQFDNTTDGSNAQDLWPEGKMVWLRNPQMSLEMATVATEDNDWQGGMYAYTHQEVNPKRSQAIVNYNCVPIIKNTKKVQHFDVTP